jgi:Bacteriocin-protection, YdeI or OmpD-Associated/Domain of unknown function (DUF1905)
VSITFRGTLYVNKQYTRIDIPERLTNRIGSERFVPARVTIAGVSADLTLHRAGGGYRFALNRSFRLAIKAGPGAILPVRVEVVRTRVVAVPGDLAVALRQSSRARSAFDALPPSHQQAYVDHVTTAKREDTRERRISHAILRLEQVGVRA